MAGSFQTGNEEVDRQFGGGIPAPSLMLLEGGGGIIYARITRKWKKGSLYYRKHC